MLQKTKCKYAFSDVSKISAETSGFCLTAYYQELIRIMLDFQEKLSFSIVAACYCEGQTPFLSLTNSIKTLRDNHKHV